jgi:hypothetical protein
MEELVAAGIGAVFLIVLSVAGIVTARVIYNRKHPPPTLKDKIDWLERELDMKEKEV